MNNLPKTTRDWLAMIVCYLCAAALFAMAVWPHEIGAWLYGLLS